jgi:hypothetical protein
MIRMQRPHSRSAHDDQPRLAQPPRLVPGQPVGEPERLAVLVEAKDDAIGRALSAQEMLPAPHPPGSCPRSVSS